MSDFLKTAQENFQNYLEQYVTARIKADRLKRTETLNIKEAAIKLAENLSKIILAVWWLVPTNAKNLRQMLTGEKPQITKLYQTSPSLPDEYAYVIESPERMYELSVLLEFAIQQELGLPVVPSTQHQHQLSAYRTVMMRPGLMLLHYEDLRFQPKSFSLLSSDLRGAVEFSCGLTPEARYAALKVSNHVWLERFRNNEAPTKETVEGWNSQSFELWCKRDEEKYKGYFQ